MKKSFLVALVASAFALSSCSPFSLVYSDEFSGENIADFHTFRIVQPEEGSIAPGVEMVTYHNITSAIRAHLIERGFKEDSKSNLLVNIGLTVKNEVETTPIVTPPYAGPYFFHPGGPIPPYAPFFLESRYDYWAMNSGTQVVSDIYEKGVLTMDLVDVKKKAPVYSAAVSAVLNDDEAKYRDIKAIAEAVDVLFSKFPIQKLPKFNKGKTK